MFDTLGAFVLNISTTNDFIDSGYNRAVKKGPARGGLAEMSEAQVIHNPGRPRNTEPSLIIPRKIVGVHLKVCRRSFYRSS